MNEDSRRSAATPPPRRSTGSMPMAGLSLCPPPLLLNPSPSSSCCSCGSSPFPHPPLPSGDDLRRLLHRIPSPLLSSSECDLSHELVRRFLGCDDDDGAAPPRFLCPGLVRCVHALVGKLLKERAAAGSLGCVARMKLEPATSSSPSSGSRKRKRDVRGLLEWLRDAAKDPIELFDQARRWRKPILDARKVMFQKLDDEVRAREFPSSKRRGKKLMEESLKKILDQPTRRSERIANNAYLKIKRLCTLRKRIGVGPTFQADIPEWIGPITASGISDNTVDVDDVKWLGTQIRPADVDESATSKTVAGKGRPTKCTCSSPGSKSCISSHVNAASLQLRSDLGQFFTHWGFDTMGEGILDTWRKEKSFAAFENESSGQSFWKMISKKLDPLSKQDSINYYYNVFLLRKIANQSRQVPDDIHTDQEEEYDEEEVVEIAQENVEAQVVSSSISSPRSGNT